MTTEALGTTRAIIARAPLSVTVDPFAPPKRPPKHASAGAVAKYVEELSDYESLVALQALAKERKHR